MDPIVVSRPSKAEAISTRDAETLMASTQWYHKFQLRPDVWTPGHSDMPAGLALDSLRVPAKLDGLRTLDIGAWDGPLTFELERRGSTAAALDIQDPTAVGFDVARRIVGSNCVHYQGSVYQLPYEELSDLDLVVFRGVYYHLKYPLLAFERISAAMKLGGTLHFEGEGFINYAEDLHGKAVPKRLMQLASSDVPVCLSYPNRYKGSSNWSVPNRACLVSWLTSAGFEANEVREYTEGGAQRLLGYATKVREQSELPEHPLC